MSEGYNGKTIKNLDELSDALCIGKPELIYHANNVGKNVSQFPKPKKNGKPRVITAPSKNLGLILSRLKVVFFDNYIYPSYVFGLGGNTLLDHADVHPAHLELVQADLSDFFPSINNNLVYKMWVSDFGVGPDLARTLTMLTTYNFSLSQGFATSSHIAGVVAKPFTTAMHDHCQNEGLNFSQYVDDLNFSGDHIEKRSLFKNLIAQARQCGFSIKKQKTQVTGPRVGKKITGTSVFADRMRAPRDVRRKAALALLALAADPGNKKLYKTALAYKGYLKHMNKRDGLRYESRLNSLLSLH